jgi:hypothetical protein
LKRGSTTALLRRRADPADALTTFRNSSKKFKLFSFWWEEKGSSFRIKQMLDFLFSIGFIGGNKHFTLSMLSSTSSTSNDASGFFVCDRLKMFAYEVGTDYMQKHP